MSSTPAATEQPRRLGQSVWAMFAGFLLVVILSVVTDVLFHKLGVFPPLGEYTPDKPLFLATAYRVIFGIMGSYVTARLAPHSPMRHALIGASALFWPRLVLPPLGTATSALTAVALIVLALPQSWLGAELFLRSVSGNS